VRGQRLGYSANAVAAANRRAIELGLELRAAAGRTPVVVSGCVGPRGDGYGPDRLMGADEAQAYHAQQIAALAQTGADMVTAITMTHVGEAVGVARAANAAGMPVAISFTLETDGKLPSGEPLGEAIRAVDAASEAPPAYYMINCAHPTHFAGELASAGVWAERLRGLRANASCRSHAELDAATDLDAGDPRELARQYAELRRLLPGLTVLGGCCGTDLRHVAAIAESCAGGPAR
jgi:homocysteine S-methyltransferase